MHLIFFGRRHLADALDEQGLAGRGCAREPSSLENCFHPLHSSSGSETDVCVLATVLDAVDIGYRVIVVRDAICSSSDEGHDI